MSARTLLSLTGADRATFLENLVSNRVPKPGEGLRYAALLTPQGKLIADFLLLAEPDRILLDVDTRLAPTLYQRLSMYKLRADVRIEETGLKVQRGTGARPDGAWPDPRHPALGWRLYGAAEQDDGTDWTAIRVDHLIPEWGIELDSDSYILEMGFERLNGVDFRKGCYVGQEVTARMKHKTDLRKGLARVTLDGPAAPGTALTADNKPVGTLGTVNGTRAIAYLRFDRATGPLDADGVAAALDPDPKSSESS